MKRQDLKEKLLDLLHGNLSPQEEEEVIAGLEKSGITREEIESMRSVNQIIDNAPVPEPSERMDKRFYAMLEEEQRKTLLGEPEAQAEETISGFFNNSRSEDSCRNSPLSSWLVRCRLVRFGNPGRK